MKESYALSAEFNVSGLSVRLLQYSRNFIVLFFYCKDSLLLNCVLYISEANSNMRL